MSRLIYIIIAFLAVAIPAAAEDLRALARVELKRSHLIDTGAGAVQLDLGLTQAVPFRVGVSENPLHITLDFHEVAFESGIEALNQSDNITAIRAGFLRPGWSRLVLELAHPMTVETAAMQTGQDKALLQVKLKPVSLAEFSQSTAVSATAKVDDGQKSDAMSGRAASGPVIVVLDPGHGGVDPGAQHNGYNEADLMLSIARELKEVLLRAGGYEVYLTRDTDAFVSLPERISIARRVRADVFISLHADALVEGRATGTTIYTLSDQASDTASATLAERQNRADILAGVDLSAHDDQIAGILIELAQLETTPRSERLADFLVENLQQNLGKLYKRPKLKAGFSVLKAPDIPSVLIELGFMSSSSDLASLQDPQWRLSAAEGIRQALDQWVTEDETQTARFRQ